ncbi:MAG TPA: PEP/pyruvate-binding domain-containing protein [Vicinamibacterales bacterium]|nr:PEP/pyruvate-binding domain-containing protein [Vicinamibacterales bacterium]
MTDADRPKIGGKAYNCAVLRRAGMPVPDGLVVPIDATPDEVAGIARDPWFDTAPPETVYAVRSSGIAEDSAEHSFAGMHETFLNVTRDRISDAVVECRRSATSVQAAAYVGARLPSDTNHAIGVLVQRMIAPRTSGVAFTINPVTGVDELVIDAVDGLGEALVGGQVTPEHSVSPKTDPTPLARLLVAIERHYGAPQDIEWCFDGSQYWILQSRPITTTHGSRRTTHDIEWTRANLAEVLPDQVSPQALDVYERLLNDCERQFFGTLLAPESELGPIIKAFHGRLYFNLAQLRHVVALAGTPFASTLRSLGHSDAIHPEDEIATRPPLRDFVRAVPEFARLTWYDVTSTRIFERHERRTEEALARLNAVDPLGLPDAEIWATFEWWLGLFPESLKTVFVMSSVQFREEFLRKTCEKVGVKYETFVYPQLAAGQRSVSTQQAIDLVALANVARVDGDGPSFQKAFQAFLDKYGHRGRYESDWALPRMREDPASVRFAIAQQVQGPPIDPAALIAKQDADAASAWRDFDARLTVWQRLTLRPRVRATLRQLKQQYLWRERVRSDLTRIAARVREWHLVLADRFVERGWLDRRDDYFLLRLSEVHDAMEHRIDPRPIAAARAAQLAAERDLDMPLFMRESELPALMRGGATVAAGDAVLTGLCVSAGSVEAEVVVLLDPGEFAYMRRGAILVTRATDPSWTPLFTLASGVIVEVGGMLSHASTIAREYGLPALANVKNATNVLRTGDRVRLDATGGVVHRL